MTRICLLYARRYIVSVTSQLLLHICHSEGCVMDETIQDTFVNFSKDQIFIKHYM